MPPCPAIVELPGYLAQARTLLSEAERLHVCESLAANPYLGRPLIPAVLDAGIEDQIHRHRDFKKAVSGIVYLRNKLQEEQEATARELEELRSRHPIAIEEGELEVAAVIEEMQREREAHLEVLKHKLQEVRAQAEEAKSSLIAFQAAIENRKRQCLKYLTERAQEETIAGLQQILHGTPLPPEARTVLWCYEPTPSTQVIYCATDPNTPVFLVMVASVLEPVLSGLSLDTVLELEKKLIAACEAWHGR